MAGYRYQNEYLKHLQEQQVYLRNDQHPDYDRDRISTQLRSIVINVVAVTTRRTNTARTFSASLLITDIKRASVPDEPTARTAGVPTTGARMPIKTRTMAITATT